MNACRLPDFFVIGAMKCGTSTLQAQLATQPGMFMTTPKEPNFFSDDAIFARGLGWYQTLFEAAQPGELKGEASTHYTKLPDYPDTVSRLAAVVPSPRLVYVIRDPIERAISHYLHEWGRGAVGADMAAAFSKHREYVDYGRYPMQLAPWLKQFGREAVLLTSLERLKSDSAGELARIGSHIGAGPLVWNSDLRAQNVSAERSRPLPLQRALVRNPVARALRHALVPKSVRTSIRMRRSRSERPALPAALRSDLEDIFRPDHAALATLFPEFTGLEASYPFATTEAAR